MRKGGWGTDLDVGLDIGQGSCPPEGQNDVLPVPGQQAFGVQALLPEQLVLVQGRLEQAASLLDRVLAALNLHKRLFFSARKSKASRPCTASASRLAFRDCIRPVKATHVLFCEEGLAL